MSKTIAITAQFETRGDSDLRKLQRLIEDAAKGGVESFERLDVEVKAVVQSMKTSMEQGGKGMAEGMKEAGAEAEKAAKRAQKAMRTLGVKSDDSARKEIARLRAEYVDLEQTGVASVNELARAKARLEERVDKVRRSIGELPPELNKAKRGADGLEQSMTRGSVVARAMGSAIRSSVVQLAAFVSVGAAGRGTLNVMQETSEAAFGMEAAITAANRQFENTGTQESWKATVSGLRKELRLYSQNEIKEAAAKTLNMTKRLGFTEEQMKTLISRTGDMAAGNKGLVDAMERVTAAMRGEAEASEALGLTLNEDYVKAWYLARGATEGAWKDLDDVTKAQIRFKVFLDQSSASVGRATEYTKSAAGAWKMMTARVSGAIANSKAVQGALQDVGKYLSENADKIGDLVASLIKAVAAVAEFVVENKRLVAVIGLLVAAGGLPRLLTFMQGAASVFPALAGAVGMAGSGLAAFVSGPVLAAIGVIGLLGAAVYAVGEYFDWWGTATAEASKGVEDLNKVQASAAEIAEARKMAERGEPEQLEALGMAGDKAAKGLDAVNEAAKGNEVGGLSEEMAGLTDEAREAQAVFDELVATLQQLDTTTKRVDTSGMFKDFSGFSSTTIAPPGNGTLAYAAGGFVPRSGRLPGYGGGDRIRALLEAGEFINDKQTVRFFGAEFFQTLKAMARGRVSSGVRRAFSSLPSLPRYAEGGLVAAAAGSSLGPSATYRVVFEAGGREFAADVRGEDSRDSVLAFARAVGRMRRTSG